MRKRQPIIATAAVFAIYLAWILLAAVIAQLQLLSSANGSLNPLLRGVLLCIGMVLFFGASIVSSTGLVSAFALRRYGIRGLLAYLGNAIASAVIAAYVFLFNFGVADNLGAILEQVPKNGRDDTDGMISLAPSFLSTLESAFRLMTALVGEEWQTFAGFSVAALIVSTICGGLFWALAVRGRVETDILTASDSEAGHGE
jgi:hypothetical protein